jgi:hypothetical protein
MSLLVLSILLCARCFMEVRISFLLVDDGMVWYWELVLGLLFDLKEQYSCSCCLGSFHGGKVF